VRATLHRHRDKGWPSLRDARVAVDRDLPDLVCTQCGRPSEGDATGWRAYRSDLPPEAEAEDPEAAEIPSVLSFCPTCAEREFAG